MGPRVQPARLKQDRYRELGVAALLEQLDGDVEVDVLALGEPACGDAS